MDDNPLGISPSNRTEDFTNWLFDPNLSGYYDFILDQPNVFGQIYSNEVPAPMFDHSMDSNGLVPDAVSSTVPSPTRASGFPECKRVQLLDLIRERFWAGGAATMLVKGQLFSGDLDHPLHVMSMVSLELYIATYFASFHDQFPLLHKPTFIPDQVNDLLLLAILGVGASLLDETQHTADFCSAAASFGTFVAWSLRWQILMDQDSGPPAKLWVLQSLAILEFYEKMNATRPLHERAHVHFAATLTLMRRGSALIGDQSTPPSRDEPAVSGSADHSWFTHWIASEATRRCAFGAFFLDALHATMFGHAATMVIHEIQLPLPVDDAQWTASTASEVARIEFSLHNNGIKPTSFLSGIKSTLMSQRVRTNPFGRLILMGGLLSIAHHMRQKELYKNTLEERSSIAAMPEGWKKQLIKAFDWWKRDFDSSLAHMQAYSVVGAKTGFRQEAHEISRHLATALYHLAHISLSVQMPDLCTLAGAKILLGRVISKADRDRVRAKMSQWANTPGARSAVLHSVRYLKLTLMSDTPADRGGRQPISSTSSTWHDGSNTDLPRSSDVVIIRPWVMYYSALVVWAYGYLLDGPLRPFPGHIFPGPRSDMTIQAMTSSNPLSADRGEAIRHDAEQYLQATGDFSDPDDLRAVTGGRNRVVGVLTMAMRALEGSRWELLHEARTRLRDCVDQLR
ncbi:Zinc finger protein klf1 [Cyphellophora attinorum]|uniref:Zinc finger protein klf1 n=1 Tax=Cyphellophora attinorum TaxID=1664694 RepID=A0A0N1P1U6_9EURO|nr:Zinc finger protein klf1 [Phialophora attinorum]KPI41273.1 Zinc finger protein klf1 [Phialophora attinorum]